jgi:hypothetical protein
MIISESCYDNTVVMESWAESVIRRS